MRDKAVANNSKTSFVFTEKTDKNSEINYKHAVTHNISKLHTKFLKPYSKMTAS